MYDHDAYCILAKSYKSFTNVVVTTVIDFAMIEHASPPLIMTTVVKTSSDIILLL